MHHLWLAGTTLMLMVWGMVSTYAQITMPNFADSKVPTSPNYTQLAHWAAHPDKKDFSDKIPRPLRGEQSRYYNQVDVFFVHPTIFRGKVSDDYWWNANLEDKKLNRQVDKMSIKYQASAFNGAGKIYAPRYRQAHLRSFYQPHLEDGKKALALAYEDVKTAFLYYLKYHNKGKPFILAGHSQGSRHLKQLLGELVDGKPLAKQLIAAYIVGWGVEKDCYQHLSIGKSPEETGCFLTWRTYNRGYESSWARDNQVCTNPLNWKADDTYASYDKNEGAVLYAFNSLRKGLVDAQVEGSILWVGEPHYWLKKFVRRNDYHIADYNLFYTNIRNNAIHRSKAYMEAPITHQ